MEIINYEKKRNDITNWGRKWVLWKAYFYICKKEFNTHEFDTDENDKNEFNIDENEFNNDENDYNAFKLYDNW